ncbi:hypothetical protein [Streptomyces sp. NPDC058045]|uniref:hypothetical protein n=1 Tax=Streptomyces sp. NPDC058045 TaxID=3346311 RepID=UPI0036F14D36
MDQGIAAAFAGAAGLIGAAVGGYAVVRGARLGAEASVRAVRQQTVDQAATEHARWLREQRLEVYAAFIGAAQDLLESAGTAQRDLTATAADDVSEACATVAGLLNRVSLLGPGALAGHAHAVMQAAWAMAHALRSAAEQGVTGGDMAWLTYLGEFDAYVRQYEGFIDIARAELGAT